MLLTITIKVVKKNLYLRALTFKEHFQFTRFLLGKSTQDLSNLKIPETWKLLQSFNININLAISSSFT